MHRKIKYVKDTYTKHKKLLRLNSDPGKGIYRPDVEIILLKIYKSNIGSSIQKWSF